jgi:hypothetical protein
MKTTNNKSNTLLKLNHNKEEVSSSTRLLTTSLLLLFFFLAANTANAQIRNWFDVKAVKGVGVRFWNGDNNYKISMSNTNDYIFGPVTSWAIKNNMSNHAGRGWSWGVNGQKPVAAINTLGDMKLKGGLDVAGLTVNGSMFSEKYVVQNGQDGGPNRGIFMWKGDDNNWGMYMAKPGTGKSLNGGTAVAGHNFDLHAFRFRANDNINQGFIWENSSEVSLMSLNASTGNMKLKGALDVAGLTINGQAIGQTAGGRQDYYDLNALKGNGFRFWNGNNNFKISMGNGTDYQYGSVTDYSIKNNMDNNAGRGWTWGVNDQVPVAALNNRGEMQLAKSLAIGGNLIPNTVLTVDGRTYISENEGTEKGFSDVSNDNYKDYLLWVEEGIVSKDFAFAELTEWPDYVFEENYQLNSLNDMEIFIKKNGHLPTMPTAEDIKENGFSVGKMTINVVKTIEELTLHTIEQQKHIDEQQKHIDVQNELIEKLAARLTSLEQKIKN